MLFLTFYDAFLLQFVCLVEHVLTRVHLFSQDPSVTQVRQAAAPGLEEYNPFTDARPVSTSTRNLVAVSSYIHVWMWTTLTRFRGLMYFQNGPCYS